MNFPAEFLRTLLATLRDVTPIVGLIVGFQLFVLRQPIPNLKRLLLGGVYVVLGLVLFLLGLEKALFPLGRMMADQLSAPSFLYGQDAVPAVAAWTDYGWIYLFAAMIGFACAVAEPTLIAVAYKAHEASGGTISEWGLRLAAAVGVALGVSLGALRIVTGVPLAMYLLAGYLIIATLTAVAPKNIIPLAYDSGYVTISTVTVPIVTALGLGLASAVPGRDPALDGFGLIAFACLLPVITVLGYAQFGHWSANRKRKNMLKKESGNAV
ncbi:MAG: DUF1538 domain-containing protein [Candidatus Electronema sp. V4]|uniref:DUF1538 domain-containing protein n=1 Tax=Candidatus Electronema sp. V4 TaxID=3454756 RepID=UPI0040557098